MSLSTKTLNTRISLKYDTWSAWSNDTVAGKGANLVLKRGEVAFCEVPSGATVDGVQNPPHILYKVGDGTKKFSELAWGSAKASDVHAWAKEDVTAFNARVSALISAALTGNGVTITGYVTESDFNAFKTTIENRVKAVEDRVTDVEERLEAVESTCGEIDNMIDEAKSELIGESTDTTQNTILAAKNAAAAADAKAQQNKTDIASINTQIANLGNTYATDAELKSTKETLEGQINAKVAQSDYNTKVAALEKADTDLAARVTPLETEVNALKTASATHATKTELNEAVAGLKSNGADTKDSETIAGAKKYADAAIDTFYNTYIENDTTALDTLKEVTEWLDANKDGAADIVSDITNLQNSKADKTDLNTHVTNKENPHEVTAAQVGAYTTGQVDNMLEAYATIDALTNEQDFITVSKANLADEAMSAKFAEVADQAGFDTDGNSIIATYETKTDANTHKTATNNPHSVTAEQVGAYTKAAADAKFATLTAFESDKVTVKEATHAASATNADKLGNVAAADYETKANASATYETITNVDVVRTRVSTLEALDQLIIDCGSSTENIF